jgi:hypothetical protein
MTTFKPGMAPTKNPKTDPRAIGYFFLKNCSGLGAQVDKYLGYAKEADHHRRQADAVAQNQNIEGEAGVAGDRIETDAGEKNSEERH